MNEPRSVRLKLANGRTLDVFHLPTATQVETTGSILGVDYWGGRLGEGIGVLLVDTAELAAAERPSGSEEKTA